MDAMDEISIKGMEKLKNSQYSSARNVFKLSIILYVPEYDRSEGWSVPGDRDFVLPYEDQQQNQYLAKVLSNRDYILSLDNLSGKKQSVITPNINIVDNPDGSRDPILIPPCKLRNKGLKGYIDSVRDFFLQFEDKIDVSKIPSVINLVFNFQNASTFILKAECVTPTFDGDELEDFKKLRDALGLNQPLTPGEMAKETFKGIFAVAMPLATVLPLWDILTKMFRNNGEIQYLGDPTTA